MPTPRKSETREQFLARRREYDRTYERTKRARDAAGKRIRKTKARSDLDKHPSWVTSVRGKSPTDQLAQWFRDGLLKVGPATSADIEARRLFLSWMYAYKHNKPHDIASLQRRAAALSRRVLERNSGFNWMVWREDYEATKAAQ